MRESSKRWTMFGAVLVLLAGLAGRADAGLVIAGPGSLPDIGQPLTNWGMQFTANRDTVLTGFDFNHQANVAINGVITLVDLSAPSSPLLTIPFLGPQGSPISFTGLDVLLHSGHKYQLLDTPSGSAYPGADLVYTYIFPTPISGIADFKNADISVTNGVYDGINSGWTADYVWYAFTNLATDVSLVGALAAPAVVAVPEPSALIVWSMLGAVGLCISGRRRRA